MFIVLKIQLSFPLFIHCFSIWRLTPALGPDLWPPAAHITWAVGFRPCQHLVIGRWTRHRHIWFISRDGKTFYHKQVREKKTVKRRCWNLTVRIIMNASASW
ncbi:hypothetical protein DFH08DRAFT_846071 [Mycena albidolilacea]|uniref:Secreted protein n=1 Tax=Mycena albidolilacea TaxID=1033008 RepID=A0AAD7AI51_9AGAR|nr:hypothetical protein DFH08DRAFT_846071 [Mycena albidolilacea]